MRKKNLSKEDDYLGLFPTWLDTLIGNLQERNVLTFRPKQIIINEYLPGQGINAHIDQPQLFGPKICSLSLGSGTTFIFKNEGKCFPFYLKRRDSLEMAEESRYKWTHEIGSCKTDVVDGKRKTRVLITFRTLK